MSTEQLRAFVASIRPEAKLPPVPEPTIDFTVWDEAARILCDE